MKKFKVTFSDQWEETLSTLCIEAKSKQGAEQKARALYKRAYNENKDVEYYSVEEVKE
jgi:hypothetical protein